MNRTTQHSWSKPEGSYEKGSDIDFAFFCHSEEEITGQLLVELDELPTQYLLNVTIYCTLKHQKLKEYMD